MPKSLHRLLYRSRSSLNGNAAACAAEASTILQTSRANNAQAGITGVLLFDGVMFLQVVEGPIAELERLYERIACDARHEGIELMDLSPIEVRDYDGWDMAFLDGSSTAHDALRLFLIRTADPGAALPGHALSAEMKAILLAA